MPSGRRGIADASWHGCDGLRMHDRCDCLSLAACSLAAVLRLVAIGLAPVLGGARTDGQAKAAAWAEPSLPYHQHITYSAFSPRAVCSGGGRHACGRVVWYSSAGVWPGHQRRHVDACALAVDRHSLCSPPPPPPNPFMQGTASDCAASQNMHGCVGTASCGPKCQVR